MSEKRRGVNVFNGLADLIYGESVGMGRRWVALEIRSEARCGAEEGRTAKLPRKGLREILPNTAHIETLPV